MPGRRLEAGVAVLGQRLVVLGGFDTSLAEGLTLTNEVDVFDPAVAMWSTLVPAPVAWTHINLAAIGGTLYLVGGLEGQQYTARGEVYKLGPGDTAWMQLTSMPAGQERGAAGIVVSPPHIFLLGGASTIGAYKSCLDYNIIDDTWSMLPDLPSPRTHLAGMRMADGTLIAAGGLRSLDATMPLDEVWALPVNATTWTARAPMPTPRGGCAYGLVLNQLICAGGEAGQAALFFTQSYDAISDVWTTLPDMPEQRAGTQGGAIGGKLYVPGGAVRLVFEPTSTLYIYDALATTTRKH